MRRIWNLLANLIFSFLGREIDPIIGQVINKIIMSWWYRQDNSDSFSCFPFIYGSYLKSIRGVRDIRWLWSTVVSPELRRVSQVNTWSHFFCLGWALADLCMFGKLMTSLRAFASLTTSHWFGYSCSNVILQEEDCLAVFIVLTTPESIWTQ